MRGYCKDAGYICIRIETDCVRALIASISSLSGNYSPSHSRRVTHAKVQNHPLAMPALSLSIANSLPGSTSAPASVASRPVADGPFIVNLGSDGRSVPGSTDSFDDLSINPNSDAAFDAANVPANRKFPICPRVDSGEAIFGRGFCPAGSEPFTSSTMSGGTDSADERASGHGEDTHELHEAAQIRKQNSAFKEMGAQVAAKDEKPLVESSEKWLQTLTTTLPTINVFRNTLKPES